MRIELSRFAISFFLLIAIAMQTAEAAPAPTKVIMTTGSFSEREAAMYVAQDQGFFRRYDLDMTFVQVSKEQTGLADLHTGETQLNERAVTAAVFGSAAEAADLVLLTGMRRRLNR